MSRLKSFFHSVPLIYGLTVILAYGMLLPFTGFYWDDWPFAWIAQFLGPGEFIPAFLPFRPFLGPIFAVTTSIIPAVPLYWQAFALIVRFAIGMAGWWMFRCIWPDRPRLAFISGLFMLVFPGYSQHWVALTHINQEWIPFLFYLLSFGFTFKALRSGRPVPYQILAALTQLCGIFPTEYFFGMEALRYILLFLVCEGSVWNRLLKTFKQGWINILIWVLNGLWLVFYYTSGRYISYGVITAQELTLPSVLIEMADTLWKTAIYIWIQGIPMIYQSFPGPVALLTIILVAASFLYMAIHVMHVNAALRGAAEEGPRFHAFLIAAGLIGILLGRIPSWIAGLPLRFQTAYDRYTIAMQIGAILALYGMIDLVSSKARIKNLAFSLIIALAIGTQFQAGNDFRRDWQKQADIFWQMAWRMPSLESSTLLLTDQMPTEYEPDLSYTAPINWMYAPSYPMPDTTSDLPYALIYTEKRLGGPTLPALEPGTDVSFAFRTVNFNGNTSEAVVIFMPRNGCLRVLDPLLGDMQTYGKESKYLVEAIPLSDPSRINLYPPSAARPMFFREPAYEWCYYYAKAELARQREDWSAVVSLGDKAAALGYSTNDPLEYLPFIEASARLGNWSRAETLAQRALNLSGESRVQKSVCLVWERILAGTPATSENQIPILHLLTEYHCTK